MPHLRVALYSAIVVERDAISRSFLNKFNFLQSLHEGGYPVEVVGFTHYTDFRAPNLHSLSDLSQLLRHPSHLAADLHVFEYSMPYDLFNSIFLLTAPSLVIDHNTTPPELIADLVTRDLCARSRHERNNLEHATHIACDGEFTAQELIEMGFDNQRVSVLHLPPAHGIRNPQRALTGSDRNGTDVRLAYIGRLVEAKGLPDLLAADALLRRQGTTGYSIAVAGSSRFADLPVIDRLTEMATRYPRSFHLLLDADDDEIDRLLSNSDALVMPSRHEGYCVPIIEALSAGCYVIGSDAGNIPHILGGLGSLYPSGDAAALAGHIGGFVNRVRMAREAGTPLTLPTSTGTLPLQDWASRVTAHLEGYGHSSYYRNFLGLVRDLAPTPGVDQEWLTHCLLQPDSGTGICADAVVS